ncbi:MAG TPA: hypothetical protein VFE05_10100 [Longimicrobiaceae bacterium]|jgi:hypothetical protein|nr:hypothetical protein [Longimicrobiaceae bacterium]
MSHATPAGQPRTLLEALPAQVREGGLLPLLFSVSNRDDAGQPPQPRGAPSDVYHAANAFCEHSPKPLTRCFAGGW